MRSRFVALLLTLVLSSSPLVSAAIAAGSDAWSQVWANPFDGRAQLGEEEAGGDDHDVWPLSERDAVEWDTDAAAVAVAVHRHAEWGERPDAPLLAGAPTPPPEGV